MDSQTQEYQIIREFFEKKYGVSYKKALFKLMAQNPYDENGNLKKEYTFTKEEKEALKLVVNAFEYKTWQSVDAFVIEKLYTLFLEEVKKNTEDLAESSSITAPGLLEVDWKINGIEIFEKEFIKKYGIKLYQKILLEVPEKYISENGEIIRDYEHAPIKLGCLSYSNPHMKPKFSKLVDLDYYMDLLRQANIPSYIDYKTNMFHYNQRKLEM